MAENPDTMLPFVSEMCTMMGSRFLRKLGLLALMCTTSRVFKVHMCKHDL